MKTAEVSDCPQGHTTVHGSVPTNARKPRRKRRSGKEVRALEKGKSERKGVIGEQSELKEVRRGVNVWTQEKKV